MENKKMKENVKKNQLTTPQTLVLGVFFSILIGAVLLKLPISNKSGNISIIDSLFTSTSAVCVTRFKYSCSCRAIHYIWTDYTNVIN